MMTSDDELPPIARFKDTMDDIMVRHHNFLLNISHKNYTKKINLLGIFIKQNLT